jgi:hypothetical protein
MMRMLGVVAVVFVIAGCHNGDEEPLRRADGSLLSSSGGDVALADGSHLQFVITSERYKQWEAARSGLRKNVSARFGQLLRPKSPTETTIERAIAFLETDIDTKESITRTGMSVRDFVLMTVALEQEMRAASGQVSPRPRTTSTSASSIQNVDSTGVRDTLVRVDSLRPARDSLAQPKRDTLGAPITSRDSVRDTTVVRDSAAVSRDSLPRA